MGEQERGDIHVGSSDLSQFEDVFLPVHYLEGPVGQPATYVPGVQPALLIQCLLGPGLVLCREAVLAPDTHRT